MITGMVASFEFWAIPSLLVTFLMVAGIVLGVCLWFFTNLWFKKKNLDREAIPLIMEMTGQSYCWAHDLSGPLKSTPSLSILLGLNHNQPIYLQDILNQFSSACAIQLRQRMMLLEKEGISFETGYFLLDDRTLIRVQGVRQKEDSHKTFVVGFWDQTAHAQELTQQKDLIIRLSEQVKQHQFLMNHLPLGLWYRNEQGAITFCNQGYADLLETSVQTVLEKNLELIDPTKRNSPFGLAKGVLENNRPQGLQTHLISQGQRRFVEMTLCPGPHRQGTMGYVIDLTDQEEMRSELRKHIEAHQEVLHHLSTPIVIYGQDMRLEFFNHAYLKLFQFDERWLHQKPTCIEILQNLRERRKLPEYMDFQAFKNMHIQMFRTLVSSFQEMIHQPDGRTLRVLTVPHPLGGLLFLFEDVTDKLDLERRYNTLLAVQKETIENLNESIFILGSDHRVRFCNRSAGDLLQKEDLEMIIGQHVGDLFEILQDLLKKHYSVKTLTNNWRHSLVELFEKRLSSTESFPITKEKALTLTYVPLSDGSHLISIRQEKEEPHAQGKGAREEQKKKARGPRLVRPHVSLQMSHEFNQENLGEKEREERILDLEEGVSSMVSEISPPPSLKKTRQASFDNQK